MANTIKIKRGLKANLPTLEVGEMGYCTDTNELFIGTATGNELINEDTSISNLDDIGDVEFTNLAEGNILIYDGDKWVNTPRDPFAIFTDTSGSPGATYPINDLDGNIMANLDKGIAYYGTVSHTDLYTSDELASAVGVTQGTSLNNQSVWHKYYWNDGIHFWRKPIRNNASWDNIAAEGAVYGTGTTTSRKGKSVTMISSNLNVQDAEVAKNGVTYVVRLMEGANVEPIESSGSDLHNSEFNLILMNLHAATNSGSYSDSPTDGVSYENWTNTANYTNDDFVGWKTDFDDDDFTVTGNGRFKWQQEASFGDPLLRGQGNLSASLSTDYAINSASIGWAPVLTVKHPSFATYGKTGGFNQNEPDW